MNKKLDGFESLFNVHISIQNLESINSVRCINNSIDECTQQYFHNTICKLEICRLFSMLSYIRYSTINSAISPHSCIPNFLLILSSSYIIVLRHLLALYYFILCFLIFQIIDFFPFYHELVYAMIMVAVNLSLSLYLFLLYHWFRANKFSTKGSTTDVST